MITLILDFLIFQHCTRQIANLFDILGNFPFFVSSFIWCFAYLTLRRTMFRNSRFYISPRVYFNKEISSYSILSNLIIKKSRDCPYFDIKLVLKFVMSNSKENGIIKRNWNNQKKMNHQNKNRKYIYTKKKKTGNSHLHIHAP